MDIDKICAKCLDYRLQYTRETGMYLECPSCFDFIIENELDQLESLRLLKHLGMMADQQSVIYQSDILKYKIL